MATLGVHGPTRQQQTAHAVRLLRALTPRARRRKVPRKLFPSAIARAYGETLRTLTVSAVAPALAQFVHQLPALVQKAKASRVDAFTALHLDVGEVKAAMDVAYAQMMQRMPVADIAAAAQRFASQVSAFGSKQVGRQMQAAFGIPLTIPDTRTPSTIAAFVDWNVSLVVDNVDRLVGTIEKDVTRGLAASRLDAAPSRGPVRQSLPALQNVALIVNRPADFDAALLAAAIQRNVAIGGSTAELAQEIEDDFGFTEDHAAFIARDQVGTLNGQLNAQRAQSIGVTRFTWQTGDDERVRDDHAERDGQVYEYADPPDGELPGEPINCRCTDEPVLDDVLDDGEEG